MAQGKTNDLIAEVHGGEKRDTTEGKNGRWAFGGSKLGLAVVGVRLKSGWTLIGFWLGCGWVMAGVLVGPWLGPGHGQVKGLVRRRAEKGTNGSQRKEDHWGAEAVWVWVR